MSLLALSSYGQDRSVWQTANDVREGSRGRMVGTVADTNEANDEIQLTPDDASSTVTVLSDTVSTVFNGFGGVINGKPEIFTGSRGFSNVRVGDRIEVRGTGRGTGSIVAEQISLLGRSIPADPVGVGDTRSPGNISTPTTVATGAGTTSRTTRIDGIVRQVNGADNRVVVETDRREMITVRGSSTTPVYYRNQPYRIRDLETGDRIRIDADTSGGTTNEITARSIEVVQSVQERSGAGTTTGSNGNQVTTISGRVTQVDRAADTVRIDNGRGEVAVDVAGTADPTGRRIRAADLQVGDQVDITGAYSSASDVFVGSTVRFVDQTLSATRPVALGPAYVTIYGTVTQSLRNAPQLTVQDSASSTPIRIYVLEDFVIRTKTNGYSTADKLKENDNVVVKAYRDADGNLIAQTIRLR
ncbi:MAG TPA: DUF5666 domain-containing protein [Thermoanaerobaculia bacterium]|nr:DUF5666 domain-containing protein [Thermoanaerobaculia bacterium]